MVLSLEHIASLVKINVGVRTLTEVLTARSPPATVTTRNADHVLNLLANVKMAIYVIQQQVYAKQPLECQ